MRVIAGEFRHRKLHEVDSKNTRETRDQVKESIFNSIQSYLYDATVLDLFSGSGSLGIEAISRGAKRAVFVDKERLAISTTQKNIDMLGIRDKADIKHSDYQSFLSASNETFDVILLDPPYRLHVIEEIISLIERQNLLAKDGIIVALYSKNVSLNIEGFDIISYKEKKIGVTNISFLKWGI